MMTRRAIVCALARAAKNLLPAGGRSLRDVA